MPASSYFFERENGGGAGGDSWVLTLFIAGSSPHSQRAVRNLEEIVAERLPGRCTVHVVDILEDPAAAIDQKVLVAPTLIRHFPLPEVRIYGNLSEREKVLAILGLVQTW